MTALVSVGDIASMLAGRIGALAPELLPGGRRQGHEWRAGSVAGEAGGSLGVHLSGGKAGVWADFSTGECGDALDLVAAVRCGGDKRAALDWARAWLGLDGADPAALERRVEAVRARQERDRAMAAEEAARTRGIAQRIWLQAEMSLRGTPVDLYLAGRGIALAELGRQPRTLRFHPSLWHQDGGKTWPAMVAIVTDGLNRNVAVHRTWLARQADGAVAKAPVTPAKMVLGPFAGASIRLWRGASNRALADMPGDETVHITEGIEDGLSVAIAMPEARVVAAISLSNMGTIALPPQCRSVTLWTQRDDSNAALLAADRAVTAHLAAGRAVARVMIPRGFKDVNDMLRAGRESAGQWLLAGNAG